MSAVLRLRPIFAVPPNFAMCHNRRGLSIPSTVRRSNEISTMDFTIFYAWQSDRPQNTLKYLIRDAAKNAVKRISRDAGVKDSPRLDHATKDVPGTPEIAGTIFRKIQESGAVIADLTFVGAADLREGHKKLLPNPNVLLEQGYATRSIGWDRIICVMNTAHGPVVEQIFDIRQRRWPIYYRLEGENTEDIQTAEEFLSGQLQNAIRMVMNSEHEVVEEAISRLTPEVTKFIKRHKAFVHFWIEDEDVGRLGAQWMANAAACLLDLKLVQVYFEPKADRFAYTWTYIGKLAIKKMEPSFPLFRPMLPRIRPVRFSGIYHPAPWLVRLTTVYTLVTALC
jgi:hypothetical protein